MSIDADIPEEVFNEDLRSLASAANHYPFGGFFSEINVDHNGKHYVVNLDIAGRRKRSEKKSEWSCDICGKKELNYFPPPYSILDADLAETIRLDTRRAVAIMKKAFDLAVYVCSICEVDNPSS